MIALIIASATSHHNHRIITPSCHYLYRITIISAPLLSRHRHRAVVVASCFAKLREALQPSSLHQSRVIIMARSCHCIIILTAYHFQGRAICSCTGVTADFNQLCSERLTSSLRAAGELAWSSGDSCDAQACVVC